MKPYFLGLLIFIGGFLALWKFIDKPTQKRWLIIAGALIIAAIIMFQVF